VQQQQQQITEEKAEHDSSGDYW